MPHAKVRTSAKRATIAKKAYGILVQPARTAKKARVPPSASPALVVGTETAVPSM